MPTGLHNEELTNSQYADLVSDLIAEGAYSLMVQLAAKNLGCLLEAHASLVGVIVSHNPAEFAVIPQAPAPTLATAIHFPAQPIPPVGPTNANNHPTWITPGTNNEDNDSSWPSPTSSGNATNGAPNKPIPKKKSKSKPEDVSKRSRYIDGSVPDNWDNLISVYNETFIGSASEDWCFYYGAGWIHNSEQSEFREDFKQCVIDQKYYRSRDMFTAGGNYNSIQRLFIYKDNSVKNNWFCCEVSMRYYAPEFKRTAFKAPCVECLISEQVIKSNTIVCDYTKERWLGSSCLKIKGSDTYKFVNKYDVESSGIFGRCHNCNHRFEKKNLKSHASIMGGNLICDDCAAKLKYDGAIGAWDFKSYPSAIYQQTKRFGHYVDENGFICATNEQQVIVSPRLLGVEAEVELWREGCEKLGLNRFDMALRVKEVLGEDFVSCKEDGTLTLNGKYNGDAKFDPDGTKNGKVYAGFEIVTCPSDIKVQRERWVKIADSKKLHNSKGVLLLRSWDTNTCGFHVHVSRNSLTTLQIGRMLKFINSSNNAKFIHKIAGRGSDVFCRYQDKELPDVLHPDRVISQDEQNNYNRSRRVALNLSNENTIEFRIFRGTIHPNHILRNLCFVMAVCDYCYPAARSLQDMDDYSKFIYFVSKNIKNNNYRELAAWFIKQGQIAKQKVMDGIDISKLTIQPDFVAEVEHVEEMKPKKAKAVSITTPQLVGVIEDNTF